MQIRYETTKLTMHPTNNRSSPEWFPCPRSSSKINRRRGFEGISQIHRRRGFGEIIQKNQNYCRRHGFGENTEEGSDAAELIVNDQN